MSASTATVDTPLRQARPGNFCGQAGRLALRGLEVLFGDRLRRLRQCLSRFGRGQTPRADAGKGVSPLRLRVPVSSGVLTVSLRTVMNNAGYTDLHEQV